MVTRMCATTRPKALVISRSRLVEMASALRSSP
jgi:hypothetical protein